MLLHTAQQHLIPPQHEFEVVGFDLLAAAVGRGEGGVVAGFDDEVGEDFVEGADCAWEGRGVVAEGYEEGGYWEGLLEVCLLEC